MKGIEDTLVLLRRLGSQTPPASLRAARFFVAGSGVLTLAFHGFTSGILRLKSALGDGLAPEYQGSTWPKITLAALAEPRSLTDQELKVLWEATAYADSMLAATPSYVEIDHLLVVEALTRSLELRGRTIRIPLSTGVALQREVPNAHARYVEDVLGQWTEQPTPEYVAMVKKTDHPREHYQRPCRAFTLVSPQPVALQAVTTLQERLARVLPHRFHWFEPAARHVTIRTLEAASDSEFESIEFFANDDLNSFTVHAGDVLRSEPAREVDEN